MTSPACSARFSQYRVSFQAASKMQRFLLTDIETVGDYHLFFQKLCKNNMSRMVLYEDCQFEYNHPWSWIRRAEHEPGPELARIIILVSRNLEHLSAAFIMDSKDFFATRDLS